MAVYKPDAVFAYKVSDTDTRDAEADLSFVESFIGMINNRDCVLDIGCGKNHYSTNEIARRCNSKGIEAIIVGVDPALALANDTEFYMKNYDIDFLAMDYRTLLGIDDLTGRKDTIGRQVIDDAIKHDARIIASALDQATMRSLSSPDEIVKALENAGYIVETFSWGKFIAKKANVSKKIVRYNDDSLSFLTDGLDKRSKEFIEYQLKKSGDY